MSALLVRIVLLCSKLLMMRSPAMSLSSNIKATAVQEGIFLAAQQAQQSIKQWRSNTLG